MAWIVLVVVRVCQQTCLVFRISNLLTILIGFSRGIVAVVRLWEEGSIWRLLRLGD